jgi:protein-tyrosine kinase
MSIAVETDLRTAHAPHARLGELLVAAGALCESDVARIVAAQRERPERFGTLALEMKLLSEAQLHRALAQQVRYPYIDETSTLSPMLAVAHDPFGAYAEAMRTLRSQLLLRWFGAERSALAIAAPGRNDGGSLVAANLALTFAQLGAKTLLIDANLREPMQHWLFGLNVGTGLADLLNGQCRSDAALHSVAPFDDLTIMPAGTRFPNPQEVLSGQLFARLLTGFASEFEIVIIDTPPLLDFADAAIVAERARGCLFSARRHHTTTQDLQRARQKLTPSGAALVGIAIND